MPVLSLISHETDESGFVNSYKYKTEKGFELSIVPTATGLWQVAASSGGVAPKICEEFFTSHLKARDELVKYLMSKDRLGFAEYPGKDPAKVRKAKVVDDGRSEDS